MNSVIAAFVVGASAALRLTVMPDLRILLWALPLLALGFWLPGSRVLAALVCGAGVALVTLQWQLQQVPAPDQLHQVVVEGVIEGLPEVSPQSTRFSFRVTQAPVGLPIRRLLLTRYAQDQAAPNQTALPVLATGQSWRLSVRLRSPRGTVNAGGFDYPAWLLSQGYGATGYVIEGELLSESQSALFDRLRASFRDRLQLALPASEVQGLLLALLIGDGSHINAANWRVLAITGTTHLLVISGLHVGLVAVFWFALLRRLPIVGAAPGLGSLPAVVALITGLAGVCLYGGLAGFGVPVQRALFMLMVVALLLALRRPVPVVRIWLLGLLVVTLLNPLVSLRAGFWLSFGAVGVLLYAFAGRQQSVDGLPVYRWVLALVRTQWVMLVGMAPLLWLWVGQLAPAAWPANLIAVPLVSLVIVPLLLVALVLVPVSVTLATWVLMLADSVMGWLWQSLVWLSVHAWIVPAVPADRLAWLLAAAGVLVLLAPRGLLPRTPGLLLMLPLVGSMPPTAPAAAEARVTVLDVGQGLSVLIETHRHVLLYDTGPKSRAGFDAGARIVVPYLRRHGIARIDTLIIGHADLDHAGGAAALLRTIDTGLVIHGEPGPGELGCTTTWRWDIDGVAFELMSLALVDERGSAVPAAANNRSCVLLVKAGGQRLLIPGDIDAAHELALLATRQPSVDVLIASHHGSRSSSHPGFLNQVAPSAVVVSAGFLNRFGHPHAETLQRYQARDMRIYNTAWDGALTIRLGGGGPITAARDSEQRLWRARRTRTDQP